MYYLLRSRTLVGWSFTRTYLYIEHELTINVARSDRDGYLVCALLPGYRTRFAFPKPDTHDPASAGLDVHKEQKSRVKVSLCFPLIKHMERTPLGQKTGCVATTIALLPKGFRDKSASLMDVGQRSLLRLQRCSIKFGLFVRSGDFQLMKQWDGWE